MRSGDAAVKYGSTNDMPALEWPTLVTIASVIFIAGGFYFMTQSTLKGIKEDIRMLNRAVADIAVQNERLDNQGAMIAATQKAQAVLEQRLYDLSQGRGFIREKMDGEYKS